MYRICGLDMQSQAAYELAVQGLVRPADNNIPMIYSIKCVDFKSPEFTLGECYNFCYLIVYTYDTIILR